MLGVGSQLLTEARHCQGLCTVHWCNKDVSRAQQQASAAERLAQSGVTAPRASWASNKAVYSHGAAGICQAHVTEGWQPFFWRCSDSRVRAISTTR